MRGRLGVTVAEALVALLLLLLLVQLTWGVASRAARAASALEAGAEGLAAERAAWWVLRDELAAAVPGRDRTVPAGDSVALRAFRGSAPVCAGDGADGRVRVRWSGVRRPEAGKDSVLLLAGDGAWRALDLVETEGPAGCGVDGGAGWERWRLGGPAPGATLVRVYERGSYHLSGGALRYRRGAAGRQPLTPEVLDDDASGLGPAAGGSLELRIRLRTAPRGAASTPWVRTLRPWGGVPGGEGA